MQNCLGHDILSLQYGGDMSAYDFLPDANAYASFLSNGQRTTPAQREVLLALSAAPGHRARNAIVAAALGSDLLKVNSALGLLGRKIIDDLGIVLPDKAIDSHALCWFDKDTDYYWESHLHPPVIAAIKQLGWAAEAEQKFAPFWRERAGLDQSYWEGRASEEARVRRARNGQAREQCLSHYGFNCQVCDLNFKDTYGALGEDFIEVHHLEEMVARAGEYEIDPIRDLRPVCSNCHRMLHRGGLKTIAILKLQLRPRR